MVNNNLISVLLVVRNPVGGIRTYMRYVYGQSVFKQCRFTVLFTESDLTDLYVDTMDKLGFDYHRCKRSMFAMLLTLFKLLSERRFDIIHSHGFTSGIISSIPARLYSIPHVMTAHDVLLANQFCDVSGWFKKKILTWIISSIDVINAVSKDVEMNIMGMLPGVSSERIISILNGVATHEFIGVEPVDLRTQLNLDQDIYLIGFFGRFMSQKGFRYLIDAVEMLASESRCLRDFRVVSVGSGGFIREDRGLINRRGLEKRFIFLPAVSNPASLLKAMDAIAIPSLWEACPLLPMEALLLGVPVIASDCIGLREVVHGTPAFLFKAGDSRKLANVISACLEDDRREDFASYRSIAQDRFDATRTGNELFKLYRRIVKSR